MAVVDRVFDLLTDGKLHSPKETAETLQIREETVVEILHFLSGFTFAQFDEEQGQVVIDPKIRALILQGELTHR